MGLIDYTGANLENGLKLSNASTALRLGIITWADYWKICNEVCQEGERKLKEAQDLRSEKVIQAAVIV